MGRIELREDYAQPARVVVGLTLLRVTFGAILVAHGAQLVLSFQAWQNELTTRFGIVEPVDVAFALVGLALVGGVGLILGWFTRASALTLLAAGVGNIVSQALRQANTFDVRLYELPALMAVGGVLFLLAGGGVASLDETLRERRRLKAIERDNLWLGHPYIPPLDRSNRADPYQYRRDSFDPRVYQR